MSLSQSEPQVNQLLIRKIDEVLSALVLRVASSQIRAPNLRVSARATKYIYNEWMSGVMISSSLMLAIAKVHFNHPTIQLFESSKNDMKVDDLIKEICNQIAGPLKKVLLGMAFDAGISLPFITPGIDEAFFNDVRDIYSISSAFDVYSDQTKLLTFSYDFQLLLSNGKTYLPVFADDLLIQLAVDGESNDVEML